MVGTLRLADPTDRNDETTTIGGTMTTETKIDTGTDELLCVIRDRVAIITLNRPEARNAMSDNLTPALRNMIKACGENPDVGVLLLTGAGTAFCAGGNVKGMGANRDKTKLAMSHDDRRAGLGAQADHCRPARPRGRRRTRSGAGLRHANCRAIGIPFHRLSQGRS